MDSSLARSTQNLEVASASLNVAAGPRKATTGAGPRIVPESDVVESLFTWITAALKSLSAFDAYLDENLAETLEMEEAQALLKVVKNLRRDCTNHLFLPEGTLAQLSQETQEGACNRKPALDTAYRQLLARLEPYCRTLVFFASNPFGGSHNPVEITEATVAMQRTSQGIHDDFLQYRESLLILLEEISRLLREG